MTIITLRSPTGGLMIQVIRSDLAGSLIRRWARIGWALAQREDGV